MAQRHVVESKCDKCSKVMHTDIINERAKLQLPDSWINVAIKAKSLDIMDMDLCDECTTKLLPILGIKVTK